MSASLEQESTPDPVRTQRSVVALTLLLVAVLLAVNALAVAGLVSARRSLVASARADLELQTLVQARTIESDLVSLRADLLLLSRSRALEQYAADREASDPMVRRWSRLNAEGAVLLFLSANPSVVRLHLGTAGQDPLLIAGSPQGDPQILAGPSLIAVEPGNTAPLRGAWPVRGRTSEEISLEAVIDPDALLGAMRPGARARLSRASPAESYDPTSPLLRATARVQDSHWDPPVDWWLVREEPEGSWIEPVSTLSRRYRSTLLTNLALIPLSLGLALLAYRQVRRATRLEALNEQQAQVRELERRLMHSERLASVGRLAAGMAHEINNPLEGMANFLRVLEDDLAQGDLQSASRWPPKLRQGLDRSASVLRRVLTFSDPARTPREWVDVAKVVAEAIDFVASNPEFNSVEIRCDRPAKTFGCLANPTTLGQLFLNLLLNACEAVVESGGSREPIEVTLRHDGERIRIGVADRGPGFDDAALEHLFEPFYSGRGSSGLGLAVCYGIVRDLGGEITASQRTGGGALVVVELPRAPSESSTAADPSGTS